MSADRPAGAPSTAAPSGWRWVRVDGEDYAVRPNRLGALDCLPRVPRLALDAKGRPRIGLLVVLDRAPAAGEDSIAPLVSQGRLTLVVTLDIPDGRLALLARSLGIACVPAFLRKVEISLGGPTGVLAEGEGAGGGALVPLSATLSPAMTLEALHGLDAGPSALSLSCRAEGGPAGLDTASLGNLVAGCGATVDREAAVRLLVLDTPGMHAADAPRRTREMPPAVATRGAAGRIAALAVGDRLTALPLALSTGRPASAAALVASAATRPGGRLSAQQAWYLGTDLETVPANDVSGPLVDDPSAATWADAADPSVRWYAPRLDLVRPAPDDLPEAAAFSFTIRPTPPVMGPAGMAPGLAATVCFTLRLSMPADASRAGALREVPLGGLTVALDLAYRQTGQAQLQHARFPGAVARDGELLRVTVELLDDWARMAYAALAFPTGTGMTPALLVVTYAFDACVPVDEAELDVVAGGKRLEVAVLEAPAPHPDPQPHFVLSQQALVTQHASLLMAREVPRPRSAPFSAVRLEAGVALERRPLIGLSRPPVIQPHPHLPERRRGRRTIAREDRVEARFPCADLGGLYLEEGEGGPSPIGCRDALKLGEPSGKAFLELTDRRDPAFRIYRSLQQPGRFLMVPTTWRVGRHGPATPDRAYRPMLLLYARLGDDPATDRYNLAGTLVPDVGAAALARLRAALRPLTPARAPLDVVLPTDPFVAAGVRFAWTVPAGMAAPTTLVVADSFTVTMEMDGPTALLVTAAIGHAGISGQVTFDLPDGTRLPGALQLDGDVVGPVEGGPVAVTRTGSSLALANRTAQPMNVFAVVCTEANGALSESPVAVTLAAGESRAVEVSLPDGTCVADARGAATAEIDTLDLFVENISQSVLFVNQLNFANHGITALAVHARIQGAGPEQAQALAEGGTLSFQFSLPVTAYLEHRKLEFALAVTTTAGAAPLVWRERELSASAVVGITPDLL